MAIEGLKIIGESINDSVPSTQAMFAANDVDGLKALAKEQDERGAAYIDVNVGRRDPAFMAKMVQEVQTVTSKPLSIDTPDYEIAKAGLTAYDPERAGGRIPVLNSISHSRLNMLELYAIQPFMPILMATEKEANGTIVPCRTGEDVYEAARQMTRKVRESGHDIPNAHLIFDPGIPPLGSDTSGMTKMVLDGLALIKADPDLAGFHASVGLSNFTVMLPPQTASGMSVKSTLESAFLTKAMPLGLDMVVGSVKRRYEVLPEDHPALQCLNDVLEREGFDCVMRVIEFYS